VRYIPRFTRFTALATAACALAVTVAVAVTGLALAQTTINVTVTGGGTFTGHTSPATFAVPGVTFTCSASTASVTINNQTISGPAPLAIGTAVNFAFTGCTGPLGATTLTPTPTTYQVAANSTTNPGGVTDLTVGTFHIAFAMTGCTFTVSGTAPGSYNNNTHVMGMGPIPPSPPVKVVKLKISKVSGCAGLVTDGQVVKFTAPYTLKKSALQIVSTDK
jgi:hypothetical protein